MFVLDRASGLSISPIKKMKLSKDGAQLAIQIATEKSSGKPRKILIIQLTKQLIAVKAALFGSHSLPAKPDPEVMSQEPRNPSAQFYDYDQDRKPAQRKRENASAMALLKQVESGEVDGAALSAEQKQILAKYSGTGGALVGADGKKGSQYEYFTPKPIAEGIWSLMAEMGFAGGKVLDPCAGAGVFGATAPTSALIDAVELNATSGQINALVNNGTGYTTTISPFERVAASTPDETYDAVVTNVPFGSNASRGGNQALDSRHKSASIHAYFVLRSLEKLRPNGLAVFITPPACVSGKGKADKVMRIRASYMAEFLGAYRLPNSVFGTAAADTMTDVMVFRKYSTEVAEKIQELRDQSPITLVDAKVQWDEFNEGKYFLGEGKRFVLGEFIAKTDPKDKWDRDRVHSTASMGEIGKLFKKFPGSRVDWEALNGIETLPILYRDGDTLTQAGQTLEMKDGQWVALAKTTDDEAAMALVGQFADPYSAFENAMPFSSAVRVIDYMEKTGQALNTPSWLRGAVFELNKLASNGDKEKYWNAGIVGMACTQVLDERLSSDGQGVDFVAEYAALSDAMQRSALAAKGRPSILSGDVKKGLDQLGLHFTKKAGFSAVWRGDVNQRQDKVVTADGGFEGLRYRSKSIWVPREEAAKLYGESFDPEGSDEWCLSPDGNSVTRAGDYYIGNYAVFIKKIDREIAAATDEGIKAKLLRQKLGAKERIDMIDVSKMSFNLFSPHVTAEEKAEFLRRNVSSYAVVVTDERTGVQRVDIDIPSSAVRTDRDKILNRLGDYLKKGSMTLGSTKMSISKADAFNEFRQLVREVNEQFDGYVKAKKQIIARLEAKASDPELLRFSQVDDESYMPIAGLRQFNPENGEPLALHGYQNAFVRKMSREFGGINGFGVGLGKTFTALASVQYAHNIGVKNKTVFVVPNSVLSNWKKETNKAYENTDDCLYVGLRVNKNGKAQVLSSAVDADLTSIMENRHSKIFMTMEAFEKINLRQETIEKYRDYLMKSDSSFAESESKKEDEETKSKTMTLVEVLTRSKGSAPFLEDLGVDSLVVDEAHAYKNSSSVVNFEGAKFLSLGKIASRGIDMQAKAWFVRGQSSLGDGVLLLTATPITNSPLEIYSMLSLANGHGRVNELCLGVKGADEFMEMMCEKENQNDISIDGVERNINVFVGLNNVDVMRKAILSTSTILSADEVGAQVVVPDADSQATSVTLPAATFKQLIQYKEAFRWAIDEKSSEHSGKNNRGNQTSFDEVSLKFGESPELMASPFNLINKMTMLILDPELDARYTKYIVSESEIDACQAVVDLFNGKKTLEKRSLPSPITDPDAIVSQKTVKDTSEGGDEKFEFSIQVRAKMVGNTVLLDTQSGKLQAAFEAMAEKAKLDLDVECPPKMAAMIENFRIEMANPRGVDAEGKRSSIVKQIVFCDMLPSHNKIKRLLVKRCGIPSSQITFITGQTNNKPDEILEVQDGFNAGGEESKYSVIICNEKAEVGINLQIGTQAIHHLTIGWTPDSLTQRNGRGVRQGNKTKSVTVYSYDADGTFDSSKRSLVQKKAGWIDGVMDVNGDSHIAVTGGMRDSEMDSLIEVLGNSEAMGWLQESIEAKNAERRAETLRDKQLINLSTMNKQRAYLDENPSSKKLAVSKLVTFWSLDKQIQMLRERIANPSASASAIAKNEATLADYLVRAKSLRAMIDSEIVFVFSGYNKSYLEREYGVAGIESAFKLFNRKYDVKKRTPRAVFDFFTGNYGIGFDVSADGEIQNEWQSENDMSIGLLAEAKTNFIKQSAGSGSLPASLAESMEKGEASSVFGFIMANGSLVKETASDGVVRLYIATDSGKKGQYLVGEHTGAIAFTHDMLKNATIAHAGSAEYDALVTLAATIEDDANVNGTGANLFSDAIPEVGQRRKSIVSIKYLAAYSTLPSPYFPYVMLNSSGGSALIQAIRRQQSTAVVLAERGHFYAPSTLGVVNKALSSRVVDEAMIDFAFAHGIDMVVTDLKSLTSLHGKITQALSVDQFKRGLELRDDEHSVDTLTRSMIAAALPMIDLSQVSISSFIPDLFRPHYDRAYMAELDAVRQARAERQQEEQQTANALTGDSDASQDAVEDVIVGITGNTKDYKSSIKAISESLGYFAGWDGKASPMRWNVYQSAWDKLVATYPAIGGELELCPATRRALKAVS
jgi:predicted RNA methylase